MFAQTAQSPQIWNGEGARGAVKFLPSTVRYLPAKESPPTPKCIPPLYIPISNPLILLADLGAAKPKCLEIQLPVIKKY